MFTLFEFILIIVFVCLLKIYWSQKNINLPPGPRNPPFVGYLFNLGMRPHLTLTDFSKRYGEVFYLRIGNRDTVVLNGHKTIMEAFCDNSITFAGRPDFLMFKILSDCLNSFSFMNYSTEWRSKRKIATKAVNVIVESRCHSPIYRDNLKTLCTHLSNKLHENLNKPYNLRDDCIYFAYQMIHCFCFGTFDQNPDEMFKEIKQNTKYFGSITSFYSIGNAFSGFNYLLYLIKLFYNPSKDKLFIMIRKNIIKRFESQFEETTCVADSLKRVVSLDANPKQELEIVHDVMVDLIGAGIETTNHFLYCAFLYASVFSEWQFKIQQQIDEIIKGDEITLDDIERLTLLKAFRLEVSRYSCILPYGIYRSVIKDITFRSYVIPKNTLIIPNIYSAHFDEKIWTDPHKFDPNRFLTETGDIDINVENRILLFGLGSRRCIGQHVADKNIITILAVLFKQFFFKPIDGENLSVDSLSNGTILEAKSYRVILTKRN